MKQSNEGCKVVLRLERKSSSQISAFRSCILYKYLLSNFILLWPLSLSLPMISSDRERVQQKHRLASLCLSPSLFLSSWRWAHGLARKVEWAIRAISSMNLAAPRLRPWEKRPTWCAMCRTAGTLRPTTFAFLQAMILTQKTPFS